MLRAVMRRLMPGAVPARTAPPEDGTTLAGTGGAFTVTGQGRGAPIVIVHGGSGDASSWAAVAALLASRYRVLRYTRPTYRHPPGPGADPAATLAAEVGDLRAVIGAAGGRPLVVGHSSGAVVALEAALADPGAPAALLLYEPPLAVDEPLGGAALRRARAALDAGDADRAMAIHLRDIVRMPAAPMAVLRLVPHLRRVLAAQAAGQIADDEALESLGTGLGRYAGVEAPVLLLAGARSPGHLGVRLRALAGVLPRVERTVVLPGQGHSANMRAPRAVAGVVAGFAAGTIG